VEVRASEDVYAIPRPGITLVPQVSKFRSTIQRTDFQAFIFKNNCPAIVTIIPFIH
jgi:hypothetical protein